MTVVEARGNRDNLNPRNIAATEASYNLQLKEAHKHLVKVSIFSDLLMPLCMHFHGRATLKLQQSYQSPYRSLRVSRDVCRALLANLSPHCRQKTTRKLG